MTAILLVDDDLELVDLLSFALRRAGFRTLPAYDSPTALRQLEEERPALAILDVNLGTWDGFELLKQVRQRTNIPVIMMTARSAEDDKVRGLELGADDYVTKPFGHRELVARIRAHLRRGGDISTPPSGGGVLEVGPLTLNLSEHTAADDGRPVDLSVTEFRLLQYLMTNAGSVVPTRAILKQVWGYDDPNGTDVVRVTLHRLRRKLERDPAKPQLLHTVPGVGVLLKPRAC